MSETNVSSADLVRSFLAAKYEDVVQAVQALAPAEIDAWAKHVIRKLDEIHPPEVSRTYSDGYVAALILNAPMSIRIEALTHVINQRQQTTDKA